MNSVQWRPVYGYEGLYEVSNQGHIRSLIGWNGHRYVKRTKELSLTKTSTGYWKVELTKNGIRKSKKVHRLVAESFIPNVEGYPVVNHKDGNPLNNNVNNLEWCTTRGNNIHACETGLKKIFDIDHEELKEQFIEKQLTSGELAKKYNVSDTTMIRVIKRHGLKKCGRKYDIDLHVLAEQFKHGMTNKELSQIYRCDSRLIASRRYQIKHGLLNV